MQDEVSTTIITVAYTPEEYEKIFAISEDRDQVNKNWEQWRQAANEKKAEASMQDAKYVEQHIDALGLVTYCLGKGIPINARARADYAHILYERQRRESIISSANSEEQEHPQTRTHTYTPPVDKLLTYTGILEEAPFPEISYAEKFGIGPEHIPELLRMVTDDYLASDDANEFEYTATLHAVRALAELHAQAAIEPLLTFYDKASEDDNDWMLETLIYFYTTIGPVALPLLEQFLADPLHDQSAQNYVTEIISKIAEKHPEARTECIAVATRRLADFEVNNPELNEALISALLRMKAVDAAPLIQAAYASGRVDDFWGGDWDEAQYELGLKERPPAQERSSLLSRPPTPARSTTSTPYTPVHKSTKKSSSSSVIIPMVLQILSFEINLDEKERKKRLR
jgi:hypothetical protein